MWVAQRQVLSMRSRTCRAPRVILAALVGGMLSVAGASYQGVFRNPLVDPYLLGAAAGAGLGATLALTTGRSVTMSWPVDPVPTSAFVVAVLTVASFWGVRLTLNLLLQQRVLETTWS